MDTASIVVSLLFGLLVGWGLSRQRVDPRPVAVALIAGILIGAVVRIGGIGADSSSVGGSLLLGCTAGLAGSIRALIPSQ